jgi:two-component system nitrogen regulation sensor histidine kinase GlnL
MAYIFSADKELYITSWSEDLVKLTGKEATEVRGKKYFEVLPPFFSNGKDALSTVLEENKTIVLKGYIFGCLLDHMSGDIRISPLRTAGMGKAVKVTLPHLSPCSVAISFRNSQRLIDIGKNASTLAHGVRNPLNAIKGAVVYLSEKYAAEPALVEFAAIMNEEIARLDNFISQFLSTSISDAGFVLTDINALMKKLQAFTSLQAHVRNIRPVYEYGDLPPVMLNAFQIEQAVLSVLNNAIDAMSSGGRLTVRTGREIHSGNFVTIEISDTGSGMAGRAVDSSSIPRGAKGKGFGLVITREVLQYHGGRLEIVSDKGKGTTVRLCLPMKGDDSTSRGKRTIGRRRGDL